jgi:D-lactate dehydrogenase
MRVLIFSARSYDRDFLKAAAAGRAHDLHFTEASLTAETAALARGFEAVCGFVNDAFDATVLRRLREGGVGLVLLRSTGFNNVDLVAAEALGIAVMRVSRYSPHAVAEFAVTLMLALNRKIHRAYQRVRDENFLLDGLLGFDLYGKTLGIVGTGRIGAALAKIGAGFGCRLLGHDVAENPACIALGLAYRPLDALLSESDIVSLHLPLTRETRHLIDAAALARMKRGAMLINTSRGAVIDTKALIQALKRGALGAVGLDVYEEEEHLFFQDLSEKPLTDDVFARLLTFPNVIVTGHQGFFTREAMTDIAKATIANLDDFAAGRVNENSLSAEGRLQPP